MHTPASPRHPLLDRRTFLQAGTIGALGLSMTDVAALRGAGPAGPTGRPRAVIFLFLAGGASQHDTFDMKPRGPAEFKGEFNPIATRTPGIQICEHLPMLAQRSRHWALCRSLTTGTDQHELGHQVILSGRLQPPPGFNPNQAQATDWPAMAALAKGRFDSAHRSS